MKGKKMKIKTNDDGRRHKRELFIKDKPVSWLDVIDFEMRIGSCTVRMGGVGGVHTEEKYRMKGYMRKLMQDTIKYMKKENYDISVLFGIPDFYTKFGFAVCLPEHKLTIPTRDAEESRKHGKKYKTRKIKKNDFDSTLELYHKNNHNRTCSLIRPKKHFSGFQKGSDYWKKTGDFLIEGKNKKPFAYAVSDKSDNMVNVVEVESRDDKLFPTILYKFVKMAISRRCENINLHMPIDHPFVQFCRRYGGVHTTHYPKNSGGMARIINQENLFKKIKMELERRLYKMNLNYNILLRIKTDIEDTTISLNNRSRKQKRYFIKLSQDKLAQLIIGYKNIREIVNDPGTIVKGDVDVLTNLFSPDIAAYMYSGDRF